MMADDRWDRRGDSDLPPPTRAAYPPEGELVFELEIDPPCADETESSCPPTLRDASAGGAGGENASSAWTDNTQWCDRCGGDGYFIVCDSNADGYEQHTERCEACDGQGVLGGANESEKGEV